MTSVPEDDLKRALADVLDPAGFIPRAECGNKYLKDWAGNTSAPVTVLRPATPEAMASVMAVLHGLGQRVAIQGGMTGLVWAGLPQPDEIVISLERMNKIESIDVVGATMTVQAGVPLESVQIAAEEKGLFFPVDIGSRGTCQVGGIISTNAGGNRVLRYGMTRASVLGLEAVLADGRVVSRMGSVLKDNAGYDLKHLFIGTEGTLGIVTRAVLALQPAQMSRHTAIVSARNFTQVVNLLSHCRSRLGSGLTSFEVMWRDYYELVINKLKACKPVFENPGEMLVLVEMTGSDPQGEDEKFAETIYEFLSSNEGSNAVVAQSLAEGIAFWKLRDSSGEAARSFDPYASFDISIPIVKMQAWAKQVHEQLRAAGVLATQTYGHIGDGNLHILLWLPSHDPADKKRISEIAYRSVGELGGSIAAEHGIGLEKKSVLGYTRSPVEIELMQAMKLAMDPLGLLNRGRIFDMPTNLAN